MKFRIRRASFYGDETKEKSPHPDARWDTYEYVDTRLIPRSDKTQIPPDDPQWYEEGPGHRIIDVKDRNRIFAARGMEDKGWIIELENFESLFRLIGDVDCEIIVNVEMGCTPTLMIYDDYIE